MSLRWSESLWPKMLTLAVVGLAAIVLYSGSASAAVQTVVVTFDDPDGVYAPGDVTESGIHVWTDDAFKFGIADWDSDGDREINLGNRGKTIKVATVDGSLFAITSFTSGACNAAHSPITIRGYDAGGTLIATKSVYDAFPYWENKTLITFDATWVNLSRVEVQSGSGGGCGNNHVLDDFTVQVDASSNKADILAGSGVPGKGLSSAPGQQKEFNPNSQAADRAGKK